MKKSEIAALLSEKGLRVTSQRIAILEAILQLDNHPTAENVIDYVKTNHPSISVGTVYKVLDSYVEHKLLTRVKTESGTMRFDSVIKKHHHLYCKESDRIEDYEDEELDQLISEYFNKKGIKNFDVKDFKIEITGTFKNSK